MSDNWNLNGHKLAYHPQRVADWLLGKAIAPLYMEVGLTNRCNHRCVFCSFSYTGYKAVDIDADYLIPALAIAASKGVKAVMFAGEGEPLLHPRIVDIVQAAKHYGMDVSITTNGRLFTKEKAQKLLPLLSWIRFSINAADSQTYAMIHGSQERDFGTVLDNLQYSCDYKRKHGLAVTIGVQSVAIEQNWNNLSQMPMALLSAKPDYYSVKPFTGHPMRSDNPLYDYRDCWQALKRSYAQRDWPFPVIMRDAAVDGLEKGRGYTECHACDFWAYIAATGDVYACSNYLGNQDYSYGNMNKMSFIDIIASKNSRRQAAIERINKSGLKQCRQICRMNLVNQYLDGLKHPPEHVNFI